MKCATRKLRSPVKWHGGKSYLCRRFIDLFPPHDTYVEPFAGGLSTLLNKSRSRVEIASDLNSDLICMWKTLRDRGDEVRTLLGTFKYSDAVFEAAKSEVGSHVAVIHAAAFIIRNRMSRGGLGKDFAWSERLRGKRRPGGAVPGEINSWETFIGHDLPRIIERIQGVSFAVQSAGFAVMNVNFDRCPLIYADPPYLHETRTHKAAYTFEMDRDQHTALLIDLHAAYRCGAKVFLSGYPSSLYDTHLDDWTRHEFDMPNHSGQGKAKQRRVECLWESP